MTRRADDDSVAIDCDRCAKEIVVLAVVRFELEESKMGEGRIRGVERYAGRAFDGLVRQPVEVVRLSAEEIEVDDLGRLVLARRRERIEVSLQ